MRSAAATKTMQLNRYELIDNYMLFIGAFTRLLFIGGLHKLNMVIPSLP